jgi:hypothetical protein
MRSLVPQDAGQLAFCLELIVQRAGDKYLSAGQGKGVDRLIVIEQVEFKLVGEPGGGGLMMRMPISSTIV